MPFGGRGDFDQNATPLSVLRLETEFGGREPETKLQQPTNHARSHARTTYYLVCMYCIVQSTIQIIRPVNINKMGFPFSSVLGGLGSLTFLFIIIVGLLFTLNHAPSAFSNYLPLSDNFL